MDINGAISFVPNENAIDDPENYGFEPLSLPLLSQCKERTIVIKQRELSRYIAIAAAVILAFFFVTPISDNAYEKNMQASIAQITAKAPAIVEESKKVEEYVISPITDTVTENIYTSQPNTVQEAETEKPAVIEEQTKEVEEVVVPQKTYSIIVASSPNAKNAELAIKDLSRKMKADYTIVVGSGRHRISAGDFDNINAANDALATIKNTFHDAWVLTH
jgi:hypothetical protein